MARQVRQPPSFDRGRGEEIRCQLSFDARFPGFTGIFRNRSPLGAKIALAIAGTMAQVPS
jgi:hypothetical protein